MRLLDLTLPTATENVALDEALLLEADAQDDPAETLRLWESPEPLVVVGRASRVAEEVQQRACREAGIPILRRTSGGAAIVAGPGCLMYALVLSLERAPHLRAVDQCHRLILGQLVAALEPLAPGIRCQGTSDLALDDRKVSGNSMQLKRRALLYHGTLLYDLSPELPGRTLRMPPRQPEYRRGRTHGDFLRMLPATADALRGQLVSAFAAEQVVEEWPKERVAELVATRYSRDDWNLRR